MEGDEAAWEPQEDIGQTKIEKLFSRQFLDLDRLRCVKTKMKSKSTGLQLKKKTLPPSS